MNAFFIYIFVLYWVWNFILSVTYIIAVDLCYCKPAFYIVYTLIYALYALLFSTGNV